MKAFDWGELAFGSKKAVNDLNATLIAAPREMSSKRFTQLVKEYLPKGNIVLGLSRESHVLGFENQPQFRMLSLARVQEIIQKVSSSPSHNKIYILNYSQRDTKHVFKELSFGRVILVNGSWKYSFHTQEPYYVLVNRGVPYRMVSPFCDEKEARQYEERINDEMSTEISDDNQILDEPQLLEVVEMSAKRSFDNSFQTGAVLAKNKGHGYRYLLSSYNKVVPYQTYAMHHGASREKNFSPPNDLNHYDAVHAEVEMLIGAQKHCLDLKETTLFINLLPCPSCARMLCETDIDEFVYVHDHSNSYAIALLEAAGKKVRRVVTNENGV